MERCDNGRWAPASKYRQLCPNGLKNAPGHKFKATIAVEDILGVIYTPNGPKRDAGFINQPTARKSRIYKIAENLETNLGRDARPYRALKNTNVLRSIQGVTINCSL